MAAVIDTSSLLAIVRYYLPFDKSGVLFQFLESQVVAGEIILLDKVLLECTYAAQGMVLHKLPFCAERKHCEDTTELLPYPKFFNQVDNQFVIPVQRAKLDVAMYNIQKERYLESADVKLLLFALKNKNTPIITEETAVANDGKLFKKIPAICNMLQLPVFSLPEYLLKCEGINLHFA